MSLEVCYECGGTGTVKLQAGKNGWVDPCDEWTCGTCQGGEFQGWIIRCPEAIRKAVEKAEKQFPTLKELKAKYGD